MLIVRRHRVLDLPLVSMVLVVLTVVLIVHGTRVEGQPAGPLLLKIGLPGLLCLAYAAFALRRIERRGDRIHWGRLRMPSSVPAQQCALHCTSTPGGRGHHVVVELFCREQPLVEVTSLNDDGTADARVAQLGEALGVQWRLHRPVPRADP